MGQGVVGVGQAVVEEQPHIRCVVVVGQGVVVVVVGRGVVVVVVVVVGRGVVVVVVVVVGQGGVVVGQGVVEEQPHIRCVVVVGQVVVVIVGRGVVVDVVVVVVVGRVVVVVLCVVGGAVVDSRLASPTPGPRSSTKLSANKPLNRGNFIAELTR